MGWLERDGVALFYEEAGGEGVPFLLVHGIACDHTYLAPQFEYFERAGHRVVAVDLRGHGRSGAPEGDYTTEGFADDLAWTCGQLGAGWVARDGERSAGVAAIAAPIFGADGGVAGAMVLSAPSVRLPARQRRKFVPLVREAASRASRDLGYVGEPPAEVTA